MKLLLLSGGSGSRLWPLSNDIRSKQFLKVFTQPETTTKQSMVQRVWNQLESFSATKDSYIVTNTSQVDLIHSQLNEQVNIVLEPARRDTFPAIALACTYLVKHSDDVNEDTVVCVAPVDMMVSNDYFQTIFDLGQKIEQLDADLGLIGIKPLHPTNKYGYMKIKEELEPSFFTIDSFVEKPEAAYAAQLIREGALWNGGVFVFKLGYMLDILKEKEMSLHFDDLYAHYDQLEKISFDYAVVEKAQNIVAALYDDNWKDLGTWNTLTEEISDKLVGKGAVSESCSNTHVINELDLPVVAHGVKDIVVAVSPDGILVSHKEKSHEIKDIIKHFQGRPMFEERRWGWYRVLDFKKSSQNEEVLTKRIGVHAGANLSYQLHHHRQEVWTIIQGEGLFVCEGTIRKIEPGDVLQIPRGSKHAIKALTDLEFIEVQIGSSLIEEDIVRLYLTWEEIEQHCKGEWTV